MSESKHTQSTWELGEFDESLGYDCMSAGVRAGPAVLDGADYGQRRSAEMEPDAKERMMADAALIAAAPDLLAAARAVVYLFAYRGEDAADYADAVEKQVKAAIAKAEDTTHA